jgi:hypothetical protein
MTKKTQQKEFCICYTELPVSKDVVVKANSEKEAMQKFKDVMMYDDQTNRIESINDCWEVTNRG